MTPRFNSFSMGFSGEESEQKELQVNSLYNIKAFSCDSQVTLQIL